MVDQIQKVETQKHLALPAAEAERLAGVAMSHGNVSVELLPNDTPEERAIATQAIRSEAAELERRMTENGLAVVPGADAVSQAELARRIQANEGHVVRVSARGEDTAEANHALADFWESSANSRRN